jgi:hypothetical protein
VSADCQPRAQPGYTLNCEEPVYVETSATVIKTGGARQGAIVEFRTRDGHLVRADVPGSEVGRTGDTSRIRYATVRPKMA